MLIYITQNVIGIATSFCKYCKTVKINSQI